MNNENQATVEQSPKPVQWSWIVQRKQTDGEAASIWKLGFIAPDGAEVRVTFHQVGGGGQTQDDPTQQPDPNAGMGGGTDPSGGAGTDPSMGGPGAAMDPSGGAGGADPSGAGMDPSMGGAGGGMDPSMGMAPPQKFTPPGHPDSDKTHEATFYVTFFSNRNPQFFMKWDTSLSHEQSLTAWITITHGIVEFVRQAKPANVILDDLANGKLKMIMRSVAMDVAAANPEYELEQTQKHHYRSFFQIKRKGSQSAFADSVAGTPAEGETQTPGASSPISGPQKPIPANAPSDGQQQSANAIDAKKQEDDAQFASHEDVPIKQTPIQQTAPSRKGLTVEIGKDYSIAVKDKDGNAIDRYRAKSPADILRWLNKKGYGANRMVIVDAEQSSGTVAEQVEPQPEIKEETTVEAVEEPKQVVEEKYVVDGKTVRVRQVLAARQAALMNYVINAPGVRCTAEATEFEFATDRDMNFKRALVELAYERTKGIVV